MIIFTCVSGRKCNFCS